MNEFEINSGVLVRCNFSSENVNIPDNVRSVGKYAFALNDTVKTVRLSKNCQGIGKGAFYKCTALETVYAESAVSLSDSAFEGCSSLKEIHLGKGLKSAGRHVFDKCFQLTVMGVQGSFAQKYANENSLFFKAEGSAENEKISVAELAEKKEKAKKIQPMLNLNMLILGGSGTGKSRFFVKPNVMQCNTSYVITDPSGELIQSCGKMLERMGYDIKVFNIDDMEHSDNYNPFYYVFKEDGTCDENAVIKMVNTFMLNTKGEGQGGDPFWDDSTKLLLSAICFFLIETDGNVCTLSNVLDLIHLAKVSEDRQDEMSELDALFEERKLLSPNALSVQYYGEFKQAAGKTMQSILISTTVRLQSFKLAKIRNLTCTDNIGLDTIGDKKTALFIIIPSSDSTYNFLAAMMYTQLFDSLYSRAIKVHHGRLPVHVRFILDEFANTGKIPDFEKILATCRKFEISVQVILQNLSQLKRLYEKSWEEIPGNCDTTIFLGGKDQTNNEYIMRELGKETIDTMNINKTKSKQGSTSYNDGIMGRELMQLDELATMPNNECLVLIRGMRPFRTDKFDVVNHMRYGMLDESNKDLNTYYLSENINTEAETEIISLGDYIVPSDDVLIESTGEISFYFVNEGEKNVPRSELEKDVSADVKSLFDDVTGMYSNVSKINAA